MFQFVFKLDLAEAEAQKNAIETIQSESSTVDRWWLELFNYPDLFSSMNGSVLYNIVRRRCWTQTNAQSGESA